MITKGLLEITLLVIQTLPCDPDNFTCDQRNFVTARKPTVLTT